MKRFKTIQARTKALIRRDWKRNPNQIIWIKAVIINGVRRELGTTGLALSETTVQGLMKAQPAHVLFGGKAEKLVIAYLCDTEECFGNHFEASYTPQELL